MADGIGKNPAGGILPASKHKATALGVYVADGEGFVTRAVPSIALTAEGIPGDRHGGLFRASDSRTPWHRRGEMIFNDRQISLVSREDLAAIAAGLGIDRVEAEWLGANVLVDGVPAFSDLPRGTRLFFASGATLVVTDRNNPCRYAGAAVAAHRPGIERLEFRFVEVAARLRGIVAYVEKPGVIAAGPIDLRVPEQWLWR